MLSKLDNGREINNCFQIDGRNSLIIVWSIDEDSFSPYRLGVLGRIDTWRSLGGCWEHYYVVVASEVVIFKIVCPGCLLSGYLGL